MAEVSLAVQSLNAPGVFITQDFAGALPSPIIPFSSAYLLGEVPSLVSTSLTTGIPYNVPIQITSLADFETRLGNGNRNAFVAPSFGPALDTYNSVKLFFRNAASDVAANLFFVRIKPVEGAELVISGDPVEYTTTTSTGLTELVYGYPIEINNFFVGRVDYDSLGSPTHIGVQVSNATPVAVATEAVLDAIVNNGPIGASVYARIRPGTVDTIELFPRNAGGYLSLSVNGVETVINTLTAGTVISGPNGVGATPSFTFERLLASDDASFGSAARVEARDYVYTIENAFDSSVHDPGFLLAPAAFAKFTPEDRLRVGIAMENRAADIEFAWMALVDSAPADGTGIQVHYGYELFDLADQTSLIGLTDPFYIRETQEFYIPTNVPTITEIQDIDLPDLFTTITVPVVGTVLEAGSIIKIADGASDFDYYIVMQDFTPTVTPIDPADPIGDASNLTHLLSTGVGPEVTPTASQTDALPILVDTIDSADVITPAASLAVTNGQYIDISDTNYAGPLTTGLFKVTADFTFDAGFSLPVDLADPVGDGSNQVNLLTPEPLQWVPEGSLLNDNGVLYYVRNAVALNAADGVPALSLTNGDLDRTIPLAYYQEWVRVNLLADTLALATFSPSDPESLTLGARNILYNNVSHEGAAREHLMYTSPFGHLAYYAPYLVDLEGFNVPPSAAVAGTALRRYREQGFQEPPAGVIYALRGVLRPQYNITRAHQQGTNPTGLNAIRLLPNQGTVIWGARTRSSNPLFRWINTRVIVNVVINSLKGAFDDKIFRAIDGSENLFRQIRGTAEGILYVLWQGAALFGGTPSQAYRVIVNRTNNPDFNLENGKINVDVFIVPVSTLEVISIRVIRTAIGQLDVEVTSGGALTGS